MRAKDVGGSFTGKTVTVEKLPMPLNRQVKKHTGKVLSTSIGVGTDFIEMDIPDFGRRTFSADYITRVH